MQDKLTEILPVPLTEEDKLELGAQIAQFEIEVEEIEHDKKTDNDLYNSRLKEKSAEALQLSKQLKSGTKDAEVECYWGLDDPKPGQKTLYRYDTGEVVRITSMQINDSQMDLPLNDIGDAEITDETYEPGEPLALPENTDAEEESGEVF
jgi:hypothetical protein